MLNKVIEKIAKSKKKIAPSINIDESIYINENHNQKKQQIKDVKLPLLCTECDRELDLFWLTDMASDKSEVKKHHEICKKTEKFKGEFCSKKFIADVYKQKVLKRKS